MTPLTDKPLVSVVVPTYNRAQIIRDTIENIFQQTYTNIELIVVDDGSTDETLAILKSFGDRIRWTAQSNAGPAAARNRGIAMACGEIVAFQDSDDVWHPSKLQRQVDLLQRAGKSVVCCICNSTIELPGKVVRSFDSANVFPFLPEGIWTNAPEILTTRFMLFNQAAAVRRDVLLRVGGFDESFRLMEDGDLALRLSLEGPWAFIRDPLATRQDKIARTLGHEATRRKVLDYEIRMREGILRSLSGSGRHSSLRPLLEQELNRAYRLLRAETMKSSNSPLRRGIGLIYQVFERYRDSLYMRAPWYPRMEACDLNSWST
jgi:glycosyltransferase involved in cell wall biosynthesis